ncbi:uncharacterized protein LOC119720741 [Patiria miniata]|uniref:Uncharacterized protein n=1 Tax=Patiria miniata TaxID=46514 RepID=A0A913Z660_PATMI|nr:uncharacterized protein LOC119720741 [Patiria miniata]
MMASEKDYKEQKDRVIKQKREGRVDPLDLYKLAPLLHRWRPSDKLPVCLLCHDVTKTPTQRGHLYPLSILREAGRDMFLDCSRGTGVTASKLAYYAFCPDCEGKFQQGETHLNPKFFKRLFHNTDQRLKVTTQNDGFPWLFYSCISIVWRILCFSSQNVDCFQLLECLRRYLLDWQDSKQIHHVQYKVKLFIFAPNSELDQQIKPDGSTNQRFFYEMFNAYISKEPTGTEPEGCAAWISCGPMHILMFYSEANFKAYHMGPEDEHLELEILSMLETETETFTVGDKASRCFPVEMYDQIVKWGTKVVSSAHRLPEEQATASSESLLHVDATHLDLLPRDVSYDTVTDEFGLPSMFRVEPTMRPCGSVTIVKASRGSDNLLFIAVKKALANKGHIALGLKINSDNTVSYMKGAAPNRSIQGGMYSTQPPLKEYIEAICCSLGFF